jgi:hypothetical protein
LYDWLAQSNMAQAHMVFLLFLVASIKLVDWADHLQGMISPDKLFYAVMVVH